VMYSIGADTGWAGACPADHPVGTAPCDATNAAAAAAAIDHVLLVFAYRAVDRFDCCSSLKTYGCRRRAANRLALDSHRRQL